MLIKWVFYDLSQDNTCKFVWIYILIRFNMLHSFRPSRDFAVPDIWFVIQLLSCVQLFVTPWTAAHQASCPHHLPEFAQTHVHWVSDVIQPSHPLSSPSPPAFNLSQHQVFSNELVLCIRWPKYWSFSFSISPSNEYSGLISFRINWFKLLAVRGILKSLLQHHSSKASILWCSAFFMVPFSHLHMTTGKTITLTLCTFVGKEISLLFNMLSICDIAFLPRKTVF